MTSQTTRPMVAEIRVQLDPSDLDACENGDHFDYADGQRASIAAMYPGARVDVEWNSVTQQRITVRGADGGPLDGQDEMRVVEDIEVALGAFWEGYCESVDA